MNKLYTITGISIVALSLFTGSAMAHGTSHKTPTKHAHTHHAPVVHKAHHAKVKKPHYALIRHKMAMSAQKYKRLISLELSKPHPNMRKLRMLRHAMAHEQARYAQHLKH